MDLLANNALSKEELYDKLKFLGRFVDVFCYLIGMNNLTRLLCLW